MRHTGEAVEEKELEGDTTTTTPAAAELLDNKAEAAAVVVVGGEGEGEGEGEAAGDGEVDGGAAVAAAVAGPEEPVSEARRPWTDSLGRRRRRQSRCTSMCVDQETPPR